LLARADALRRPAELLLWLARYHASGDALPPPLAARLADQIRGEPDLRGWRLSEIITQADAYRRSVRDAWGEFVGNLVAERNEGYAIGDRALSFTRDSAVQDAVPALLRAEALVPTVLDKEVGVPTWARPAIVVDEDAARVRQLTETAAAIREHLAQESLRWEDWSSLARRWAQLNVWRSLFDVRLPGQLLRDLTALQTALHERFAVWLRPNYTALATRRLPQPHHLWHVPTWLENRHIVGQQRLALVVLDGMADWLLIRHAWQARHRT
jgi:hypothetical protein